MLDKFHRDVSYSCIIFVRRSNVNVKMFYLLDFNVNIVHLY